MELIISGRKKIMKNFSDALWIKLEKGKIFSPDIKMINEVIMAFEI